MRKPSKPLDHDPEAVTEAREAADVTQYALAKQLGVARSLISEIEKGTRNAKPDLLRRMAAILDCRASELEAKRAQGPAAAAADVDVRQVRDTERAVPDSMPGLR